MDDLRPLIDQIKDNPDLVLARSSSDRFATPALEILMLHNRYMPSDDFVALMSPHKASLRRLTLHAVSSKRSNWHQVLLWIVHDLMLAFFVLDNAKLNHEEGPWKLYDKNGKHIRRESWIFYGPSQVERRVRESMDTMHNQKSR